MDALAKILYGKRSSGFQVVIYSASAGCLQHLSNRRTPCYHHSRSATYDSWSSFARPRASKYDATFLLRGIALAHLVTPQIS